MRLLCAVLLAACVLVLCPAAGGGGAAAFVQLTQPSSMSKQQLVLEAKIVCGTIEGSFTCRRVPGGAARGKNAFPGERDSPPGDALVAPQDGLSPAPGVTAGAAQTLPGAIPKSCPENSELLGGHCIPYTQRCSAGILPNAPPPQCQGAEEKQVCNFHADGSKDCCCRIYSKF